MEKIGLIAGNRKFPIIFAESARKKGYSVIAVGIRGDTSRSLKKHVHQLHWLNLSEFSRMFEIFKAEGIKKVTMAGQISPWRLFAKDIGADPMLKKLLDSLQDKKADTIFGAVAAVLGEKGFELMDSTIFIGEHLPGKGTLTARQPTFSEWEDIYFGLDLAKEIALLDIGQTVAVKHKAVVAVEALEGTDNTIRRAGQITRGGFALIKVSKPKQDMRFDIPVVGLNTVKTLVRSGAGILAIEAGKTMFIDKAESVALADKRNLCIVAV